MFSFIKSTGPPKRRPSTSPRLHISCRRPLCLCNLIIISFILLCSYFFQNQISYDSMNGKKVSVSGTVIGKELRKSAGGIEEFLVLKQENRSCFLCTMAEEEEPVIGSRVCISGTFFTYESASNPGQFDAAAYYASQGIYGRIVSESCSIMQKPSGISGVLFCGKEQLFRLRRYLCGQLRWQFGEENGALLSAMLLGERVYLQDEIKSLYQEAGIFHVAAISGLHISLLGMGLFTFLLKIFRKLIPRKPRCTLMGALLFSVAGMGVYTIMTGMSASALRAFSLFVLLLLAKWCRRTFDTLTALSCCGVWLLFINPGYAGQSGFLLSFSAILGITLLKPALFRKNSFSWIPSGKTFPTPFGTNHSNFQKLSGLLAEGFATSLSVWFFTLPIQCWFFYEVSLAGLFLNLIVVPLAGPLLVVCMAAIAFSHIHTFFLWLSAEILPILPAGMLSFLPATAERVCHMVVSLILFIYKSCATVAAGIVNSTWTPGKPSLIRILFAYAIMALFIFISNRKEEFQVRYRAGLLLGVILLFMPVPGKNLTVTFLDVGQGDCICLEVPDGGVYLFDGGSSSINNAGTYRLEPFLKAKGIRHLNAVFLSHGDEDHVNGILELLNNPHFTIEMIVLPDRSPKMLSEEFGSVLTAAGKQKIDIRCIAAGASFQLNEVNVLCLNPKASGDTAALNSNAGSAVYYITYGNFSLLLTGDLEEEGEKHVTSLLRQYDISRVSVLKVAHHGSRNSTGTEFLRQLTPDVAVVSCGKNNRYGHPHEETIERLKEVGACIYRTDELGAVRITIHKSGTSMEVEGYMTR